MGIRAALDAMIIDKVEDQGSFRRNVDEFVKAGYLSVRQRQTLDAILDAGHAAVHRGWNPTADDINKLLDIAEGMIATIYIHEGGAQNLEEKVPRRRPSN